MIVISSELGIVLSFKNKKELQGVIGHLQGMLKWVENENIPPPHLYCIHDDRIPSKEIEKYLDEIKCTRWCVEVTFQEEK